MPGKPAARHGDAFICPLSFANGATGTHTGGNIIATGSSKVFINGVAAAIVGDTCMCPPDSIPQNKVAANSTKVFFGGKKAARQTDQTEHTGGTIQVGSANVYIGG